jgi:hypothetical protein
MDIRSEIRKIIYEAFATKHFKDRVYDRLESEATNFSYDSQENKKKVYDAISFLRQVNFPGQDNIGIMLFKSPTKYVYHKELENKTEHSEGNYVWTILRGNDIETIVFGDSSYRPKETQIHLTIQNLMYYIHTQKLGDTNLTEKDLRKLQSGITKQAQPEKKEPEQPIINIGGTKYVVDKQSEKIYQKNNPKKESNIWDIFDSLPEKTQEEVMAIFE